MCACFQLPKFGAFLGLLPSCYSAGYLRGEQGSHLEMGKAPRVKSTSVEIFSFDRCRRALQRGRISVQGTLLFLELKAMMKQVGRENKQKSKKCFKIYYALDWFVLHW